MQSSRALVRVHSALWAKVLGTALFAVATALSAQVRVFLPFSPVPLTLQVVMVVLSGFVLGPWGALAAQTAYLQAIALGAPYTASGLSGLAAFASPTAGYLLSFPLAAFVAGWLSRRASHPVAWRALGGLAALAIIYLSGMAWLSAFVGGLGAAWKLGVAPFILADLLKVTIAVAALSARRH
ncbi:MAG: biotin transporter BioY [Chloroflexi bacterium]|nr:biotin transporter BioY [Chloroflexota bacterium]